jgi:hypothetical protein
MSNSKGTVVAPKVSDVHSEAVTSIDTSQTNQVAEPSVDIMQMARLGDIAGIKLLYESKKFNPTYCDSEGLTPLHVSLLGFFVSFVTNKFSGPL